MCFLIIYKVLDNYGTSTSGMRHPVSLKRLIDFNNKTLRMNLGNWKRQGKEQFG